MVAVVPFVKLFDYANSGVVVGVLQGWRGGVAVTRAAGSRW